MALRISLQPDAASYLESGHDRMRTTMVDAGPPRLRKDKAASNPVVSLAWTVFGNDFTTLMSAYTNSRNVEWEIDLVSASAGRAAYLCRLLPNTFAWEPQSGASFRVTCSVEVMGEA